MLDIYNALSGIVIFGDGCVHAYIDKQTCTDISIVQGMTCCFTDFSPKASTCQLRSSLVTGAFSLSLASLQKTKELVFFPK